jgi:threonine dehydrogenase-like Zn-dependent dehydrogenase
VEKEDETTREQDRDDYRGGAGYRPSVRRSLCPGRGAGGVMCRLCGRLFNKCLNLRTYGSTLDGGFSEYVDAGTVHSAEGLSMRAAALAEPLACVLHGLNRLSLSSSFTR